MDAFESLARDFGYWPHGKFSPMKSEGSRPTSSLATVTEESNNKMASSVTDFGYDKNFKNSASANNDEARSNATSLNLPVYDKPVCDDENLKGLAGFRSKSMSSPASPRYEVNIFASIAISPPKRSEKSDHLNDLISSSGSGIPASSIRSKSEQASKPTANANETCNGTDSSFVVLESTSIAPNLYISESGTSKNRGSSVSGDLYDDIDPPNGFGNSTPEFTSERNNRGKDRSPTKERSGMGRTRASTNKDSTQKASFRYPEGRSLVYDIRESHPPVFKFPEVSINHHRSFDQSTSPPSYIEASSQMGQRADEIWLTISEIPLFTQPTRAPPPSRPPPPIPRHFAKPERVSLHSNSRKVVNGVSSPRVSTGRMQNNNCGEDMGSTLAAAAAMKEAMDRAEAKFKHAKEVRERGNTKAFRKKESMQPDRDEQREKEENEREQRQLEKERKRELEREKARKVVEQATREARDRAAFAHKKAERAAVRRAQAEAHEREAIGAKERAERAATEAREKVEEDTRRRAERAAVERVAAEARKRATAEARERVATSRMNQQKNDDVLESFFSTGTRPSSVPRPRATSSDSASDPLYQNNRQGPERAHRTSTTGGSSNMRKASSTTNIVNDLNTFFGGAPTHGQFQEFEGETEERQRARLEREQRTQERAAKALAEKNLRDLQSQREQEERHRIGETLDTELKRWAAGKEGNLRALLSTLQYVLWPECGWQPVSLTDLITGANVKKAYRKATLCIHPDKVQQKGANLQQKYVAEKVFDILKEAWNKLNSEELV